MTELAGKVALVTGGSRGIGRAVAVKLGAAGACVAVHYRAAREAADAAVAAIEAAGGTGFALAADLGAREGPERLITALDAELQRRFGAARFDILVNNAGIWSRGPIEDVSDADYDALWTTNFRAPFFLCKLAAPQLRPGGRIVNISSTASRIAWPDMPLYGPAKAALDWLTVVLAAHLGPRGITVNAVAPGSTATDMNPRARDPEGAKTLGAMAALGRVAQPDDIAEVVAFLASERARWITGQRIEASGGLRL